jgi:unsaturated rhamnogalacturonyl hydrolase
MLKIFKCFLIIFSVFFLAASSLIAQQEIQRTSGFAVKNSPGYFGQLAAETAMKIWPDSFLLSGDKVAKWRYDQGVILKGIESVWVASGQKKWFNYIQGAMDHYVDNDGSIKGYKPGEYNIDHINNGKVLLMLFQVTGKEKYKKAADLLRTQMKTHPRTQEGGFWHKNIYPHQMWLDGLYMAQPFLAEYAKLFHEDSLYDDIAKQFVLMERNARDPSTGLLYHGWDERKQQAWANKETGRSPHFWGRSLGWFGMALVDVLDFFPQDHPQRNELISILNRLVTAVVKVQDPKTGLWYDLPNLRSSKPNYPEASASAMLTYTIAKATRLGYIPEKLYAKAEQAYHSIIKNFVVDTSGKLTLKGTVAVSGLGGSPYRDGSFAYYMSEPVVDNDPKGLGAFILCAAEMEYGKHRKQAAGKQVYLDNYFNNEYRKDATGRSVKWHYVWDERDNGGYHVLGELFKKYGAATTLFSERPTTAGLSKADVYIIVDPDTERETARPNFMGTDDVTVIKNWVFNGGTLVLLSNDSINAEFTHFNTLSTAFGIQFNQDLFNAVPKDIFDLGSVYTGDATHVFGANKKLFIKELSTLSLSGDAKPLVTKNGANIMAVTSYGKGRVFALGDPWIYNEYIDGRRLPDGFENFEAAEQWVKWLLGLKVDQ